MSVGFDITKYLERYLLESGALQGRQIIWHCHLTLLTELAARAVLASGAKIVFSECNSGTTQSAAVDKLRALGCPVYTGEGSEYQAIKHFEGAAKSIDILADTGYVLIPAFVQIASRDMIQKLCGASEITTSGIVRLRQNPPPFAVININDGILKSEIENYHGVGDGLIEALELTLATKLVGKNVGVVGYGKVGAGCARYLKIAGARVRVIECDPVRALTAHFDGFDLQTLDSALAASEILVTATGRPGLIGKNQWFAAANNLVVANVGHQSAEVCPDVLAQMATAVTDCNTGIKSYELVSEGIKKTVYLLTDGNPCNVTLLTGSDNPTMLHLTTEIMTWSYIAQNLNNLAVPGEVKIPDQVERAASIVALEALGHKLMFGSGCKSI